MLSFKGNPEVFCQWAKSHNSVETALAAFAGPFHEGSWTEAPADYVRHLAWPPFWESATLAAARELRAKLIEQVLSGPMSDAAHGALPDLFKTAGFAQLDEAPKIVAWLVEHAGPNDATLIADVLGHVLRSKDEKFIGDGFPLVEWLLKKGSSELRSGRRSQMVAHLVPLVARLGSADLLAPAIRYVLYNEHRVGADGWGQQTVEKLLPAVELLLEQSQTDAIIDDLLAACEPGALGAYFEKVLRDWTNFPKSRTAMVRRLARGGMTSDGRPPVPETWALVAAGPSIDVEITEVTIACAAAEGLARQSRRVAGSSADDDLVVWGHVIAREFLRMSDLLATRNPADVRQLQQCAGFNASVADGVYQAVRDAAVERSQDPALDGMRELLTSPGIASMVVVPALGLVTSAPAAAPGSRTSIALDHVVEAIEHALRAGAPTVSGFNLKEAVQGAVHVKLGDLPDERAFLIEGDTLSISKVAIEGLCRVSEDRELQQALGVLYTVHEVVHGFQGAAAKASVSEVRFAGAESALMHIDLGADHIAAVVTNAAFPAWDLLSLKGWQGQSIRGFPAGPRNPPYSRIRKTLRLVGLRVDLALRKLGIGSEHLTSESYGFADFSPSGGAFVAMVNRPPFVLVKTSTINAADAGILFEGISGNEGAIERVDVVVERALAG